VFTDSLPSDGRLIHARVGSGGNVFTELLRSNGYTRDVIILGLSCVNYKKLGVTYGTVINFYFIRHFLEDATVFLLPLNWCDPMRRRAVAVEARMNP
jgi:hypothetical protein